MAMRHLVAVGVAWLMPLTLSAQVDTTKRQPPRDSVKLAAPAASPAQPPMSPADSAAERIRQRNARIADSLRLDSLDKAVKGDTIKAPLARFEMPHDVELSPRLRFSREQILQTGAENIVDILDKVPGITTYRSGWTAGLHAATYLGDGARLRLFLDGVELDPIGSRSRGLEDLTDIALWTLDELVIERTPGEVRVWMRTWTVTKTIPYTRVDIFTGDLNTNAFRGQFARRWRNGMLLQLGGQQVATQTGRVSAFTTSGVSRGRGDGTLQGFLFRTGWSRGKMSVDLFAQAVSRDRDPHTAREGFTDLPGFKGQRRDGYLRLGYGDTTRGFWAQALVQALRSKIDNKDSVLIVGKDTTKIQMDTVTGRTQQVAAVGYRGRNWQLSLTDRLRVQPGYSQHAPALRGSYSLGMLDAGLWVERNGRDSTERAEAFVRVQPLAWLRLTTAYSRRSPNDSTLRPVNNASRAEAAVRFRRLWLGGGLIRTDRAVYQNLPLLGLPNIEIAAAPSQGILASAQGILYKAIQMDLQAVRWNTGQYNRPRTAVHAELAVVTDWRKRFPKGEFGLNTRIMYDRRDGVPFNYGTVATPELQVTEVAQVVTGLLEIRIQQATLFYEYRNLTGGAYEQIRGITMPPAVQLYGMRWTFFN
ncbi:MAG: Plug domain-containing protein [Gemmatimonadaceae bacterium]|nr:Plug domain-containing protein [Gemmatimonadaceae bacterium]